MGIVNFMQSYSNLLIWILGAIFGWIWWSLKKRFVPKEDLLPLIIRIDDVEKKVADMPSQKDFHKTLLTIEHMAGQLQEQKAIMERVEKTLDRQQEYLMNKDR